MRAGTIRAEAPRPFAGPTGAPLSPWLAADAERARGFREPGCAWSPEGGVPPGREAAAGGPSPDGRRAASPGAVTLGAEALDALMPMHVVLDASGRILRHGPLVARLGTAGVEAGSAGSAAPGRPGGRPDGARSTEAGPTGREAEPDAEPIGRAGDEATGPKAAPADGSAADAGPGLAGARLFDLFAFRRPRGLASMAALREACGATLRLTLRAEPRTQLAGVAVPLPDGGALLDLSFGLGVVEAVRRHRLTATDFAPTDMAVEMLYLVEANAAVMAESRDLVDRLQGARMAAEAEAQSDPLTGLRNRRALDQVLAGLLRQEEAFALMALDLDLFKQVNDTLGHAAGDAVLREAARVMLGVVRSGDVVARAGGDEFVILFPGLVRTERLAEIAGRLIEGLERPMLAEGARCAISASIGVATTAAYERASAERMTADADAALYASKKAGRGRATIWTPRGEVVLDPSRAEGDAMGRVALRPYGDRGSEGP